jgi:G3E family GTPase
LADLIEGGLAEGDSAAVLLSEGEAPDPADERLPSVSRWTSPSPDSIEAELPQGASHVFIVTDGRRNPVDQIEAFKNWLGLRASQVDVVLCVVDCRLAEKHTRLLAWFEACIFFSDVVLLNHREGVGNKWVGDFIERFHKKFYPCLFEFVKEGGVKNPALVLSPVARRMSHVFDEQEWVPDEEEEDEESEDDVEMKPEEDYYMERRNGGRRVHELPHIADFLPPLA